MPDSVPRPTLPKFTAAPRKTLAGWTPEKQHSFIEALAITGSVRLATEAVGMSHCGVYKLRTAPGSGSFCRAWDIAVSMGASRVRDVLFDHVINGTPEDVVVGGKTIAQRRKFNHRTMIWVLQHHMPDAYPGGSTINGAVRRPSKPQPAPYDDPEAILKRMTERIKRIAEKRYGAQHGGKPEVKEVESDR